MPLPAAIAAVVATAGAVIAGIYAAMPESGQRIAREEFDRVARPYLEGYAKDVLQNALKSIGLPMDLDEDGAITPASVTRAINEGPLAGTGIELTNVFSREACKRDLVRIGLQRAAAAYGVEIHDTSAEGLKEALKAHISQQFSEQLAAGAGEWLDAVPELVELSRQLASAVRQGLIDEQGNYVAPELYSDPYHVSLRERQQRYAEKHGRVWVDR